MGSHNRTKRRAIWRSAVREAKAAGLPEPEWEPDPQPDPKPQRKERNTAKFGAADPREPDDRRQRERRNTSLSEEQISARMRELGIHSDRRRGKGDRRSGIDRRR
jgi:hypothetical protein